MAFNGLHYDFTEGKSQNVWTFSDTDLQIYIQHSQYYSTYVYSLFTVDTKQIQVVNERFYEAWCLVFGGLNPVSPCLHGVCTQGETGFLPISSQSKSSLPVSNLCIL